MERGIICAFFLLAFILQQPLFFLNLPRLSSMDQMMPGMDGIETAARIREISPRYKKTPIVALTANAINGSDEMFYSQGFNDYLSKPVELTLMNRCLARWLL